MIIDEIPESYGESEMVLRSRVNQEFNNTCEFNGQASLVRIRSLYRVGFKQRQRPRPVMIQFENQNDISIITRNNAQLMQGVYIKPDLPVEIEQRRQKLCTALNRARTMPENRGWCKLENDRLILNVKVYTVEPVNNLHELPDTLNIRKLCENHGEKTIAFFGYESPFSNFYDCKFMKDNIEYHSSEQYIQALKAQCFDDDDTHARIMKSNTAYEAKILGAKVKNYVDQCDGEQHAIDECLQKFVQNPELCRMLIETDGKDLAEATRDQHWGTGVPLNSTGVLDHAQWTGNNIMDKVLMRVRDAIK